MGDKHWKRAERMIAADCGGREMSKKRIGPLAWMSGDAYYRSSLWLALPHSYLIVFLGWAWPRVLWLR